MTEAERDPSDLLPLPPAQLHILLALADGEKHGYAVMSEVERSRARLSYLPPNDPRFETFLDDVVAAAFLAEHKATFHEHANELRVVEGLLEAGERIAVTGYAASEPDPEAQRTDFRAPAKRVVIREIEHVPLYITDDSTGLEADRRTSSDIPGPAK